jgi:hypothetical protein
MLCESTKFITGSLRAFQHTTYCQDEGINKLPPTAGPLSTYYMQNNQYGGHIKIIDTQLEYIDSRIIANMEIII